MRNTLAMQHDKSLRGAVSGTHNCASQEDNLHQHGGGCTRPTAHTARPPTQMQTSDRQRNSERVVVGGRLPRDTPHPRLPSQHYYHHAASSSRLPHQRVADRSKALHPFLQVAMESPLMTNKRGFGWVRRQALLRASCLACGQYHDVCYHEQPPSECV